MRSPIAIACRHGFARRLLARYVSGAVVSRCVINVTKLDVDGSRCCGAAGICLLPEPHARRHHRAVHAGLLLNTTSVRHYRDARICKTLASERATISKSAGIRKSCSGCRHGRETAFFLDVTVCRSLLSSFDTIDATRRSATVAARRSQRDAARRTISIDVRRHETKTARRKHLRWCTYSGDDVRSVGRSVSRSVGTSVGCSVGQLVGRSDGRPVVRHFSARPPLVCYRAAVA